MKTHRMYGTRIYKVYYAMLERCYCLNYKHYNRYGGRGITICEEWKNSFVNFNNWAQSNGYVLGLQLDRHPDNNGPYSPDNCRWVTPQLNSRNRRSNVIVEYNEKRYTLVEFITAYGVVSRSTISRRREQGWDTVTAVITPKRWALKKINESNTILRASEKLL